MAFEDPKVVGGTDPLGNLTPEGLAARDRGTTGPAALGADVGQDNLPLSPVPSGGATMLERMHPAQRSGFIKRFGDAFKASLRDAVKTNPEAIHQPGAVSRMLVGGAVEALGGTLGDIGAIGAVPRGGGALTGIGKTLGARTQRIQEARKNEALIAETNARRVYQENLNHKLDQEAVDSSIANGQATVNKFKTMPRPSQVLVEDADSDELMKKTGIDPSKPVDPTKGTAYPTGKRQVGTKDGKPVYRTTYTALKVPEDITLDSADPDDKAILDRLNKFRPPAEGRKWEGEAGTTNYGKAHFSGPEFNMIYQQAAESETAARARRKTLETNEIEDADRGVQLEAIRIRPEIISALSHTNNDPIKAFDMLSKMRDENGAPRYPNLQQDFVEYYKGKNGKGDEWQQIQEKHEQKVDQVAMSIDEFSKKAMTAPADEAASMAAVAQTQAEQAPDAATKQRWLNLRDQLKKQAQAGVQQTLDKKAAEQKAEAGDMAGVAKLIVNEFDLGAIKDFTSYRGQQKADLAKEIAKAAQAAGYDVRQWSPSKIESMAKTNERFTVPGNKAADNITSFNQFLQHAGEAWDANQEWRRTNSPFLNKSMEWLSQNAKTDPTYIKLVTALAPVQKEFMSFLNNNRAEHEDDIRIMNDKILNQATSPLGIEVALGQLSVGAQARLGELANEYKRSMNGKDFEFMNKQPMVSDEAKAGLRKIQSGGQQANQVPRDARNTIMKGGRVVGYVDSKGQIVRF